LEAVRTSWALEAEVYRGGPLGLVVGTQFTGYFSCDSCIPHGAIVTWSAETEVGSIIFTLNSRSGRVRILFTDVTCFAITIWSLERDVLAGFSF